MRDALKLPILAAATLGLVGPQPWPNSPVIDPWTGPPRGRLKPFKKRNPNSAKQTAAKRARKVTRRNRP